MAKRMQVLVVALAAVVVATALAFLGGLVEQTFFDEEFGLDWNDVGAAAIWALTVGVTVATLAWLTSRTRRARGTPGGGGGS